MFKLYNYLIYFIFDIPPYDFGTLLDLISTSLEVSS